MKLSVSPPAVREVVARATRLIADLEADGYGAKDIAAGVALALQRLPARALQKAFPRHVAVGQAGFAFLREVLKAAEEGAKRG